MPKEALLEPVPLGTAWFGCVPAHVVMYGGTALLLSLRERRRLLLTAADPFAFAARTHDEVVHVHMMIYARVSLQVRELGWKYQCALLPESRGVSASTR